jgi:type I restriction enzyme S subunit
VSSGWKNALLGELCTVCAGGTPSRSKPEYWDGDTPWVKISDMLQGTITATEERITRLGLENSAAKLLPAGTLLLSIFATIGRTAVLGIEAATNQAIVGLSVRDRNQLDLDFLRRFLELKTVELEGRARGVAQANINGAILKSLEIPLPPLAEQRRITEVLDRAEALRAKRRAALAQLDSLTQSLFLDLFGDPVANDRKWPMRSVSDFVAGFESGKSIVADDEDDTTSPYRVLKVSAVTSLEFRPEQNKAMPPGYEPPASHIVRAGDLLFSRANTSELIGATAYVASTPPNLLLPDKLWRFVWHEEQKADPHFVRFLFQRPRFRREIAQRASGTSGSMKNISQDKVLTIRAGLPPIKLQREFARRVTAVEALKTAQRASLAELDALFATLQHRAFRGEL